MLTEKNILNMTLLKQTKKSIESTLSLKYLKMGFIIPLSLVIS